MKTKPKPLKVNPDKAAQADQLGADFAAMARLYARGYIGDEVKEKINWSIMDRVMAMSVPAPKPRKVKP